MEPAMWIGVAHDKVSELLDRIAVDAGYEVEIPASGSNHFDVGLIGKRSCDLVTLADFDGNTLAERKCDLVARADAARCFTMTPGLPNLSIGAESDGHRSVIISVHPRRTGDAPWSETNHEVSCSVLIDDPADDHEDGYFADDVISAVVGDARSLPFRA